MLSVQRFIRWARRGAALTGLLFFSARAHAQGCAMCYTTASAARAGAIQALRSGILILLIPPLVMFAGIFVVVYRSRNRFYGAADWTVEQEREWREMLLRMDSVEQTEFRGRMLPSVVRSPSSVVRGTPHVGDGPLTMDH